MGELVSIVGRQGAYVDGVEVVFIEDERGYRTLLPNASDFARSGFSWGYGGNGPDALALSILMHRLGETDALPSRSLAHEMCSDFDRDFMFPRFPRDQPFRVDVKDVDEWIASWMTSATGMERVTGATRTTLGHRQNVEQSRAQARKAGYSDLARRPLLEIFQDLGDAMRHGDEVTLIACQRELAHRHDM